MSNAIATIVPTTVALHNSDAPESMVDPQSPLGQSLALQGVYVGAPGSQRAIAKAVTALATKVMTGAAVLAARAGDVNALRAVACMDAADDRVYERAAKGRK